MFENSLLRIAAINGSYNEVVANLYHGADPNDQDVVGCTALHWAVDGSFFKIVELLLKKGARVDINNAINVTPLILARQRGNDGITRLLNRHADSAVAA